MTEVMRCADLPASAQFEAWHDSICDTYIPLDAAPLSNDRGFPGGIVAQTFGQVHVSQVAGGPVRVRRTSRSIARSDPGMFKLGLQVRGYSVVAQDGREAALTPGDFAIYDTSRPFELLFDDTFRMLVVMFPRELLKVRSDAMAGLTARRVSGRQGLGAVASSFLGTLGREVESGCVGGSLQLSDAVLDLLTATFAEQLGCESGVPSETHRRALLLQIQVFVDSRLDDAGLNVPTIAAAHHISVRFLQKLFEDEGTTVTAWVRHRRLDKCRRDLTDPTLSGRPVSAVAARWGLADAGHFSKLFKAAYGQTPREYRLTPKGT